MSLPQKSIDLMIELIEKQAELRKNAVQGGLESEPLAALLLEMYARGVRDCSKAALGDIPNGLRNEDIQKFAVALDPDFLETTTKRYTSFAKLDLTTPHR
jgi:hypothetical protein